MHMRLLKGEMGKWYGRDVILPVVVITSIGLIARINLPIDSSKLTMLLSVLSVFTLSFGASTWVAGYLDTNKLKVIKP